MRTIKGNTTFSPQHRIVQSKLNDHSTIGLSLLTQALFLTRFFILKDMRNDKENNSQSDDETNRAADRGLCWRYLPDVPFRPLWFLTIRGSENFHIYLWIAKDLAWAQVCIRLADVGVRAMGSANLTRGVEMLSRGGLLCGYSSTMRQYYFPTTRKIGMISCGGPTRR